MDKDRDRCKDQDKLRSLPTIREIVIAAFFIGCYAVQFSYMNNQLSMVSSQNDLMAHEINVLQIQSSAQTIKIEYITQQLNWMRERWG